MNQSSLRTTVALLALAFTSLAASAVTPAIASVGAEFVDVPKMMLSLLSTLPSLMCVPVSLAAGHLAGRRFSFRGLAIAGLSIMLVSGVAPYFSRGYYGILFWRLLFGIGMGATGPLLASLTLLLYEKNKARVQAGNNSISTNVGAIVFQLVGGFICTEFGWRSTFLIYVLLIPCILLVVLFLPEPGETLLQAGNGAATGNVGWSGLYPVVKWCIISFIYMVAFYALVTQTSSVVRASGFGTASTSGVILALFTVGGVAGGFLYRKIAPWEHKVVLLAVVCGAMGYAIMSFAGNVVLFTMGEMVVGVGFGLFIPAINTTIGFAIPAALRPTASAVLVAGNNIGGFLSAFILAAGAKALGLHSERSFFLLGTVIFAALILLFVGMTRKESARKRQFSK